MFAGNSPLTGDIVSPITRNMTPNAANGATDSINSWLLAAGQNDYRMSLPLAGAGKVSFYLAVTGGTMVNSVVLVTSKIANSFLRIDRYTWIGGEPNTSQWYYVTGTEILIQLTTGVAQTAGTRVNASLHVMSM